MVARPRVPGPECLWAGGALLGQLRTARLGSPAPATVPVAGEQV
ncbi:hypothetical protein [Kitasatospora atroaurantiaca]|nr:hypothetical protein [Kitasatospora atroaurantiaca]